MESCNNQGVESKNWNACCSDVYLKEWHNMWVIVLVKELFTTKKEWFVFSEFRYNQSSVNDEASSSGVGIKIVSPVRRGESKSNKTAWVAVGTSASTVEVAEGWEIGSGLVGDDGETNSVIIKGTCSLDPGDRVGSIEADSVGKAGPVDFKWENCPLESRTGGTVGGMRRLRIFTSSWPGTCATFFVVAGTEQSLAVFPEMSETRSSHFG